jgi:CDP-paratose 2-epimerase
MSRGKALVVGPAARLPEGVTWERLGGLKRGRNRGFNKLSYKIVLVIQKALVTGSCGLIGSEVCEHLGRHGFRVSGIDNNERAVFFGPEGDTSWSLRRLRDNIPGYEHFDLDIRNREGILRLIAQLRPNVIIHTAAQPSHDRAASIPFDDFDTNAVGTLNLLEAARRTCPESPFVHMSTNKVYGDLPNTIHLKELESRWHYDDATYEDGIPETFPIDHSKHSLFGASKVAADVMVQEYGRYFGMPTCCLRGGCLTGPNHSGVELHGFLSYLIRCNIEKRQYNVFGYKGKQVRDNIHSEDVANFILAFCQAPRSGEVYNIGGGRENSCSILEAFAMVEELTGKPQKYTYVEQNRAGDHICYYSDLRKMKAHFPGWQITRALHDIFREIVDAWHARLDSAVPVAGN